MKNRLSFACFALMLILLVSCKDDVKVASGPAKIEFEETLHDFGNYSILESRSHTFKFSNTGSNPLVIEKVETSCACTQIDYPKEPIMPGKKGQVKITYAARQKRGHFKRNVYLYSNGSEQPVMLVITGEQH